MKLGANTWIWVSPLTDERLTQLAPRVRDWGFDVVELPIEQLGDWSPEHAAEVLAEHGLGASIAVAMAPGRELCGADKETVATTQAFLRDCLDVAATVGAGAIAGPIYTSTGRTWRISPDERQKLYAELRENLAPVAELRRRGRRADRDRAARPLRDEPDQHRRAGARGDRPPARLGRPAARHLPRERGGEGLRRRRSGSAGRGSRTSTPRPTTAAPPATTTSTGRASATRSWSPATTARS